LPNCADIGPESVYLNLAGLIYHAAMSEDSFYAASQFGSLLD